MEPDLQQHHHHQFQNQHHQQQMNVGLMRYQSAPSSYLASFLDSCIGGGGGVVDCEQYLHARASSPETERILARFMSEDLSSHDFREIQQNSTAADHQQAQFVASMKHEAEGLRPPKQQQQQPPPPPPPPLQQQQQRQRNDYSSASPIIYQNASQPPLHDDRVVSSVQNDQSPQMKMAGANSSNLIRHSSSPAGLFSHINVDNGYGVMRGTGNLGSGNVTNGEASFSSASRLRGQINFSSGPPSSSGLLARMSDIGSKSLRDNSPDSERFSRGHGNKGSYIAGFPIGAWDDSAILPDNYAGLKRTRDDDRKLGEPGNSAPVALPRHMSLPKTSAELATIQKLLQFQDSVPCKIRAKRGCATHPRSIAERVRRTRISERMRKLQELVPNMDKQTNTSDMLDLAVEYIKDLQKQAKTLSDNRAKCMCSNQRKQ